MDNASIITETPQRKGLSLKWKWALGSAAGVFLIFIIFAWFVVQAFSSQMLKTERQQVAVRRYRLSQRDCKIWMKRNYHRLMLMPCCDQSQMT